MLGLHWRIFYDNRIKWKRNILLYELDDKEGKIIYEEDDGLLTGANIVIAFGCVGILLIVVLIIICILKRRNKKEEKRKENEEIPGKKEGEIIHQKIKDDKENNMK